MKTLHGTILAVVMAAFQAFAAGERRAPFDDGERAAFMGDSITYGGAYVFYLQLFQELRAPGSGARVINAGKSGDTSNGGIERWGKDVAPMKPDSVFVMFGMNDVRPKDYNDALPDPAIAKSRAESLGRYMWDFGGRKPIGVDTMRRQLDFALEKFRCGEIDGVIFHCTPLVDKNIPEVEMCRKWIADHGQESIGRLGRR